MSGLVLKVILASVIFDIALFCGFLIWAGLPAANSEQYKNSVVTFIENSKTQGFDGSLRVLTYNLGYASGMENNKGLTYDRDFVLKNLGVAANLLKEKKADMIALQEVDFDSQRSFGINQLKYLSEKLELPYGAYALNWSKHYIPFPYWPPQIHFGRMQSGIAILSRYPILSNEVTYFDKPRNNSFWYNWFYLDRNVQHVVIEAGDYKVHVYNLHLEAFDHEARLEQVIKLAEIVNSTKSYRSIVMGDFNDPQKETLDKKQTDTTSVFAKKISLNPIFPIGSMKTFPADAPLEQLDHIFISRHFDVKNMGVPRLPSSDHLPLWAELELR